jgi:hypothetical protein
LTPIPIENRADRCGLETRNQQMGSDLGCDECLNVFRGLCLSSDPSDGAQSPSQTQNTPRQNSLKNPISLRGLRDQIEYEVPAKSWQYIHKRSTDWRIWMHVQSILMENRNIRENLVKNDRIAETVFDREMFKSRS